MGDPAIWAAAIVTGVFTIAAALVGFWSSERATQRRLNDERRELAGRVATLLHVEIDRNLQLLHALRDKIETALEGGNDEMNFLRRARFIDEPMPFWSKVTFESQVSHLAEVLSADAIRRVFDLYSSFDTLLMLQARIARRARANLAEDYFEWKPESRVMGAAQFEQRSFYKEIVDFNLKTGEDWGRAWAIISQMLSAGNPVPLPTKLLAAEGRTGRVMKMLPWNRPRGNVPLPSQVSVG